MNNYICKICGKDTKESIDKWAIDWCVETQICLKCCMEQEQDCNECSKMTDVCQL